MKKILLTIFFLGCLLNNLASSKNLQDINLSFNFNPSKILSQNSSVKYFPAGSHENGKWSGIKVFFKTDFGSCKYERIYLNSDILMTDSLHDAINSMTVKSPYYRIKWEEKTSNKMIRTHTLKCKSTVNSTEITSTKVISLAQQLNEI